ncbi:MAG: hypothetical protein K2N54_06995 [Helicobacter sp.]|nr:hypothetical protein [Helicobacter sp.]
MMSATKVAPPKNIQNHKRFHVSLRASGASVAINEQRIPKRIPTRLIATRLTPLAMTKDI